MFIASIFSVNNSGLKGTQLVKFTSAGVLYSDFNSQGYSRISQTENISFKKAVMLENEDVIFSATDYESGYKAVLRSMNIFSTTCGGFNVIKLSNGKVMVIPFD